MKELLMKTILVILHDIGMIVSVASCSSLGILLVILVDHHATFPAHRFRRFKTQITPLVMALIIIFVLSLLITIRLEVLI